MGLYADEFCAVYHISRRIKHFCAIGRDDLAKPFQKELRKMCPTTRRATFYDDTGSHMTADFERYLADKWGDEDTLRAFAERYRDEFEEFVKERYEEIDHE